MTDGTLSLEDQRRLREELTKAFNGPPPQTFLADIGLLRASWPPPDANPANAWLHVIQQIDAGSAVDFPALLSEAGRLFPRNGLFAELREGFSPASRTSSRSREGDAQNGSPPQEAADAYGVRPNVQAFVQAAREEDRRKVLAAMEDLAPQMQFATNSTMLVEFASADIGSVFEQLERLRLPVEWTVVAPGQPAYLISHLIAQGPDGRRFLLGDTPASTQIQDLAASVLTAYPSSGGTRRTVTDRELSGGQGERMRPDQTLHEANVCDGERFRVGYETNAGAVNPTLREEALTRARNQLLEFAAAHGWGLVADAPERATVYEVTFSQPSFGPPPPPDGPGIVHEHAVQIAFGPDFPQSAPTVYWLTPVFHPNIYPNYDCDEALAHPQLQGYVCLGELEDGYQPGLDLGQLCLTLLDIAGFRNYSLQVPSGDVVRTVSGLVVARTGNALDPTAARWVRDNQESLQAVGGQPLQGSPADATHRPYRHLIEPLDP